MASFTFRKITFKKYQLTIQTSHVAIGDKVYQTNDFQKLFLRCIFLLTLLKCRMTYSNNVPSILFNKEKLISQLNSDTFGQSRIPIVPFVRLQNVRNIKMAPEIDRYSKTCAPTLYVYTHQKYISNITFEYLTCLPIEYVIESITTSMLLISHYQVSFSCFSTAQMCTMI